MDSDDQARAEVRLCTVPRRQRADEYAMVLLAEGLTPRIAALQRSFVLTVPEAEAERARSVLGEWTAERRSERLARDEDPPPPLDLQPGIIVSIALLAVFLVSGSRQAGGPWFEYGSADAARILAGEGFRTVTALTLHADLLHLLSNVVAGTLFLGAVCGILGAGVGSLLVLLAGAAGNLANAMLYGSSHVSVGASTAVFAAVGILGGVGVVRRRRQGVAGRRAWLPFAAAFGLLAMMGMSERTDVSAHFFGFVAGCLAGPVAGWALPEPPPRGIQWLAGTAGAGLVVSCWGVAFGG
ncbi:MAG: rhomboid family intramembrane serine protease [Deltaproteobacteria bacterium]|nr:rhomboid family intramembrane serine protease [Deltaproteobacteria bacterium]MBW2446219.1 rhomboid family intramembrane serine protease [Deltaproteobacteria bacterium]